MKGHKLPDGHFDSVRAHRSALLRTFTHLCFDGVWRFSFFLNYCLALLSLSWPRVILLLIIFQNDFYLSPQRGALNVQLVAGRSDGDNNSSERPSLAELEPAL